MRPLIAKLFHDESGAMVVIVAVVLTVLLGFTALAVDVGILYLEHTRLARAADAAVLAGAQELPDTAKAQAKAREYAQLNGIDPSSLVITFSPDNKQMKVRYHRTEIHGVV